MKNTHHAEMQELVHRQGPLLDGSIASSNKPKLDPCNRRVIMSEENFGTKPRKASWTTARKIISLGPICDSCLGRQFAMLSTGFTNAERGRSLKTVLAMQACADEDRRHPGRAGAVFSAGATQAGQKGRG